MKKMMRYLVQPRDRIFVNGYRFLCFAKNMGENIDNNVSRNLLIRLKHMPQMGLKVLQEEQLQKQLKQLVI